MFLKFSLSFLFLILAVSCVDTKRKRKASHPDAPELTTERKELADNTIIEKAFENCKKWFSLKFNFIPQTISELVYTEYMGDTPEEFAFIRAYIEGNLPQEPSYYPINSQLFTTLFKKHCKLTQKDVEAFAEVRAAAVKRKDANGIPVISLEFRVHPDREVMSE